ncbi:hypothetical protein Q9L58_009424 [Maublancomyces gigas]|uniref:FAS1 domain-containing protein n=1 Tax=Discina gigas TaxID=1032678 RepID=A0ABR3G6X7_9PEZI
MKLAISLLTLLPLTTAQLLYPLLFRDSTPPGRTVTPTDQRTLHLHYPPSSDMSHATDQPTGTPLLADVLPLDKSISIFSGFTRSVESISTRVADREANTTVLAPSNVAISRLPRKPWEDPADEGAGGNVFSEIYRGLAGEDRASKNLRTFVEAHCVGVSPWVKGQKTKTLEGKVVWWDEDDEGVRTIYPDNIQIEERRNEASNGEVWFLKGVINY